MKHKKLILPVIIFAFTLSQGSNLKAQEVKTAAKVTTSTKAATGTMKKPVLTKPTKMVKGGTAKMNGGEILAIVYMVDSDEIDAAKKAETKDLNKEVRTFAQMMIKDHGMNQQKTKKLQTSMKVTDVKSATASKIHNGDAAQLTKIMKLKATAFDKAYMDMMVDGHKKVLDMINKQLLPSATDTGLKNHMTDTKKAVENHLAMAEKVRKGLK